MIQDQMPDEEAGKIIFKGQVDRELDEATFDCRGQSIARCAAEQRFVYRHAKPCSIWRTIKLWLNWELTP